MKRFACLVLAAALLALCGCAAAPASSGTAAEAPPVQGPGLVRHPMAAEACDLLTRRDLPVRVQLLGDDYSGKRVQTTPALLAGIANALYYSAREGAEAGVTADTVPPSDPAGPGQPAPVFIAVPDAGWVIYLYPQGEDCTVLVSETGERTLLPYPAAVYGAVLALAEENLVPDIVDFESEGEAVVMPARGDGREVTATQWMDCAGGLAALYTWRPDEGGEASALEIFDPATGERVYQTDIGGKALRMEAASFAACDMRVLMDDGAVWYLNSQNPEARPYYFYLPGALRDRLLAPIPMDRPVFRAYDGGTGQGALWAVVDEEGITWARRSSGGTIQNDVIFGKLPPEVGIAGDFAPQFGDVRVMNGGATLVATVVLPGTQPGTVGLFTYQISSGAMDWYFGMFHPSGGNLRFVDDTRLLVAGREEIFRLNVATGETATTPSPEGVGAGRTPDYERFVLSGRTLNPDGTQTFTLYTSYDERPFASATGGGTPLLMAGVTENYVLYVLRESDADTWYLTRWP